MSIDWRIADAAAATSLQTPNGSRRLAHTGLWLRSTAVRDVMSRVVMPGTDYGTLRNSVRAGAAKVPSDVDAARRWIHLAFLVGQQLLEPDDFEDSIAYFNMAREVLPVSRWTPRDARALAQCLWFSGRASEITADLLNRMPSDERELLEVDLIGLADGVGSARWTEQLGKVFTSRGVTPIALEEGGGTTFDRLTSDVAPRTVSGPLVSVVMSAFRPGAEIMPAVASILRQSWADLQLLVVDDASGPEFNGVFGEVAALDPRVQVIRQPVNRGAYAARNRGLAAAAGEFVTFMDSDDWSHPERIEHQMRPLLENPNLLGTHSSCIRASEELVFQYVGNKTMRQNASSHLFRRSVLDHLGEFHRVRKGADSEFDLRLQAAFPGRGVVLKEPLAMVRLIPNSLSRDDFLPGWFHPDRAEYRDSMRHWHRAIESGAEPRLSSDLSPVPLTAPRSFLRDSDMGMPDDPDLLVLADWTMDETLHRAAFDQIRRRSGSGARAGVVAGRSLRGFGAPGRERLSRNIRDAVASGKVLSVSLEDHVHVPVLEVWQPDVLQFPPALKVGVSAERVEIIDDGGEGVLWAREDVERVARDWFGVEPQWQADRRPVVDPLLFRTPRSRLRARRPVVGWIAESDGSDLPSVDDVVREIYPGSEDVDVRLVGVRRPLSRVELGASRSWLIYEPGEVSAREFWHQVDFAVAAPSRPRRSAFEQSVSEALAAGCVVVLPPSCSSWFGDAVVAAEPGEVSATVHRLHGDRRAYLAQVERGRHWARNHT